MKDEVNGTYRFDIDSIIFTEIRRLMKNTESTLITVFFDDQNSWTEINT